MDFSIVSATVEAAVSALESFKVSMGPRLKKFMDDVPASPTGSFYFRKQKIVDDSKQRQQFTTVTNSFIDNLVENLRSHFPDNDRLSAFSIFDPQRLYTCSRSRFGSLWY